jgi:hypothetical protein
MGHESDEAEAVDAEAALAQTRPKPISKAHADALRAKLAMVGNELRNGLEAGDVGDGGSHPRSMR